MVSRIQVLDFTYCVEGNVLIPPNYRDMGSTKDNLLDDYSNATLAFLAKMVDASCGDAMRYLHYARNLSNKCREIDSSKGELHDFLSEEMKKARKSARLTCLDRRVCELIDGREYQKAIRVSQKAFRKKYQLTIDERAIFFYHISDSFFHLNQFGAAEIAADAGRNNQCKDTTIQRKLIKIQREAAEKFEKT